MYRPQQDRMNAAEVNWVKRAQDFTPDIPNFIDGRATALRKSAIYCRKKDAFIQSRSNPAKAARLEACASCLRLTRPVRKAACSTAALMASGRNRNCGSFRFTWPARYS